MSARASVGSFTITDTGVQTRVELGFEPTGMFIFSNRAGLHTFRNGECSWDVGITDGINNRSYAGNSGLLFGWEAANGASSDEFCILGMSNQAGPFFLPTILLEGNITFDSTGFTPSIDYNLNSLSNGQVYNYIVFGEDITCKVGHIQLGNSGTYNITGIPFIPTGFLNFNNSVVGGTVSGDSISPSFGCACKCNNEQHELNGFVAGFQSTSDDSSQQISGYFNGRTVLATITSWNSDGITFTLSGGTTASRLCYLMLGNCAFNSGVFNQATATGLQSIVIEADVPKAIIIASFGKVTSTSVERDMLLSLGASDGINSRGIWTGTLDAQTNPLKVDEKSSLTKPILLATPTGNLSSTLKADATVTLSQNSLGINWTTADAVARELFYIIVGETGRGTEADCGVGAIGRAGGIYKLVPLKRNDTYYADVGIPGISDPIEATVKIPDPYAITYLMHDEEENIIHTGLVKMRVVGFGELENTLIDMDSVTNQSLSVVNMTTTAEDEPIILSNFKSQKTKFKILTDTIDEWFNIGKIVLFVKTLWSDFSK